MHLLLLFIMYDGLEAQSIEDGMLKNGNETIMETTVVTVTSKNMTDVLSTELEKLEETTAELIEDDQRNRLILLAIAISCVTVAISIIGAGICFYKKYGGSHYGSGHIRILSEDGSIEEEVMYVLQRDGQILRSNAATKAPIFKGRNLGYVYADLQGNILKNGIVNPLRSASLPIHGGYHQHHQHSPSSNPSPLVKEAKTPKMQQNLPRSSSTPSATATTAVPAGATTTTGATTTAQVTVELPSSHSLSPASSVKSLRKSVIVDSKSDLLAIDA